VTVSRPAVLSAGDEVRLAGRVFTVVALTGTAARLADVAGEETVMPLGRLLADTSLEVLTLPKRPRVPLSPEGLLEGAPAAVVEQARWWERHVVEVLTGLPPESAPGVAGRPEYDPAARSLRQRETAKVAELVAAGHRVGLSTLQRLRRSYETEGLWGLVDHRLTRPAAPSGRVDARVVDAVRRAVAEETNRSTGTRGRLRRRVEQILAAEHGLDAPVIPAKTTFYRLVDRVSAGRHTFGSARTRRSLAKQPVGPFGAVAAARPGELVQIDSTPLDVRVVLDNGLVDRVELTGMVDLATRTIPAAVLRPSTKAVDAALLLARALTPEPMRPGWSDALRMSRSVLPHRRLVDVDARLEQAAARPVIVPETIVCDRGKVYLSEAFRSACRALGITLQPAHPDTPTDKPVIERTLGSVGTLFAQHVAGYAGSSVERRGRNAEAEAAWSMVELQALLDEWVVAVWQNRPHDGLRHPATPGRPLTPNEAYAALVEVAGYVPVPLSEEDYLELLPVCWRTVNSYGVKISHRVYDCRTLNPYRRQYSGVAAKQGLWEIHYDPYDVTQIWVRNHHDGGWITVPWTHLRTTPVPFGEQAWNHARRLLSARGQDPATEEEIAQAVKTLLDKAEQGPADQRKPSKTDRRVAARSRATTDPAWPRPGPPPPEPVAGVDDAEDGAVVGADSAGLAEVVPLGIFDAGEEAKKWW